MRILHQYFYLPFCHIILLMQFLTMEGLRPMIMTIRARCSGDCLHTHTHTQPTHQQAIDCKIISAKAGLVGYHLNLTHYSSFCKDKKGENRELCHRGLSFLISKSLHEILEIFSWWCLNVLTVLKDFEILGEKWTCVNLKISSSIFAHF